MNTIFNIGLDTNIGGRLPISYALLKLSKIIKVDNYEIKRSNTEETLIANTSEFISNKQVEQLCDILYQDAIAFMRGNEGHLVHGKNHTKHWGEFNKKYFIK